MVNSLLGVIRANALASKELNQDVTGDDNLLLAELALRGQFWEVPERLFCRRTHEAAASQDRSMKGKLQWLSAGRPCIARFALPRLVMAHFEAIGRAPRTRREKIGAVLSYVSAYAHARIRHRRHRLASLVGRGACSASHSFRRAG
jgi:hypothetical protein